MLPVHSFDTDFFFRRRRRRRRSPRGAHIFIDRNAYFRNTYTQYNIYIHI